MARPSKLPELEALVSNRLADLELAFERQNVDNRSPTLPSTIDGKVNVRAFTVDVCGLPRSNEQHLYRYPVLAALVNAVAMRQGLKPIGARAVSGGDTRRVQKRLTRVDSKQRDQVRTLAEQEELIERLRLENVSLRERLRLIEDS